MPNAGGPLSPDREETRPDSAPSSSLEAASTIAEGQQGLSLLTEATRRKRKLSSRKNRALADLYLLAGIAGEAIHSYNEAIEEAKVIQDLGTQAGALEGISVALLVDVWWAIRSGVEVITVTFTIFFSLAEVFFLLEKLTEHNLLS